MSINALLLPVDIPWKRLAVSTDMYAADDTKPLPVKWRSSLAVFSYDPPPDPELPNPDELTTYLKITATVTGYQPEGKEIDHNAVNGLFSTSKFDNWEKLVGAYYPALSALVQVAVFPSSPNPRGGKWPLAEYPCVTDFEPKKREVVELVSDTGEALTQSATDLNVRKGTTTTDSVDNSAINRGGSFGFSGGAQAAGVGLTFGGSGSSNLTSGSQSTLGNQGVNVTTTDSSREKRESYSHTTNLAQLYEVLDSYHSGTNRAIWLLNSRPHILDSAFTFVNGPRRLEGVQEFFLVVRRPADMKDFCVKAVLETAHLATSSTTTVKTTGVPAPGQTSQTFTASSSDDDQGAACGGTIKIPDGYQLDTSRGGGTATIHFDGSDDVPVAMPPGTSFQIKFSTDSDHRLEAIPRITVFDDHVDFWATVFDGDETLTGWVFYKWASPPGQETTKTTRVDLFLTGREVTSCIHLKPVPTIDHTVPVLQITEPYVAYEKTLDPQTGELLNAASGTGREAVVAANAVSREVRDHVVQSFRSEARYKPGAIDFTYTKFVLGQLKQPVLESLTGKAQDLLGRAPGLDESVRRTIEANAGDLTIEHALRLSSEGLARRTGLQEVTARKLQAQLMGLRTSGAGSPQPPSKTITGSTD